jgi:uncharacterized protein (TIGR02646 family)
MRYIDIRDSEPPKDWLQEAEQLTLQLIAITDQNERKNFIEKHQKFWQDPRILKWLRERSHGKCWYTEATVEANYAHVDHFRPKNRVTYKFKHHPPHEGYWWLAFDWTNYRYSADVPNVHKRDKFDLHPDSRVHTLGGIAVNDELHYFLDPTVSSDPDLLTFDCNGSVMPIRKKGWEYNRALYTIEVLNLNGYIPLVESRKAKWNDVYCRWSRLQLCIKKALDSEPPSAVLRQSITQEMCELAKLLCAKKEFSMVARRCLEQLAKTEDAKSKGSNAQELVNSLLSLAGNF